jgi:hypothetical protein
MAWRIVLVHALSGGNRYVPGHARGKAKRRRKAKSVDLLPGAFEDSTLTHFADIRYHTTTIVRSINKSLQHSMVTS